MSRRGNREMIEKIIVNPDPKLMKILKPFLKENTLEIVNRDKKKKYKEFTKLIFKSMPKQKEQAQKLLDKAVNLMDKNLDLAKKNQRLLKNLSKLQGVNTIFGVLNLCATCAGFAIMISKLDKMSAQIDFLMKTVKEGQDLMSNYEFHKVLSDHSDMLDARKRQKYYSEDKMRELVDREYNVLVLLIEGFEKNHTSDVKNLIVSIYSMAAMMTVSLRYYDELYYVNNKDVIGEGDVWHSSHDNWTAVLDKLLEDSFLEKIQDHAVFDLGLTMTQADDFYIGLCDQVEDMKETIADNQTLIQQLGNFDNKAAYDELINREVAAGIKDAFEQAGGALEDPEVSKAYKETLKLMALAV